MTDEVLQAVAQAMKGWQILRQARLAHHQGEIKHLATILDLSEKSQARHPSTNEEAGAILGKQTVPSVTRGSIHQRFIAEHLLCEIFKTDDFTQIGKSIRALCKNKKGLPLVLSLMNDLDMIYIALMHIYFGVNCRGCIDDKKVETAKASRNLLSFYLAFDPGSTA